MPLERRAVGAVEIVLLPSRLDGMSAPDVRQELRDIVAGGRTRLLLDLSRVVFVDSMGLSVLVTTLKATASANGGMALVNVPAPVAVLLRVTRLERVCDVFDDEATALAALGA